MDASPDDGVERSLDGKKSTTKKGSHIAYTLVLMDTKPNTNELRAGGEMWRSIDT